MPARRDIVVNHPPAPARPRLVLWDLLGSCNLRCPSCPIGNSPESVRKGMISQERFDAILTKLARDFPGPRAGSAMQLHFYNWSEPLIHPRINDFCAAAAVKGFHLHVSSNLNHLSAPEGLLAAGGKTIRVSVSGFSQPVYQVGHRNGSIEKVKANMIRLAAAKQATGSHTRIHVYYHKYRHNLHELALMERFARDLGFDFIHDWAFLMPVEKLIDYMDDRLAADERSFVDDHIVPGIPEIVDFMRQRRGETCELIEQLVLDFEGNVSLCCATFGPETDRLVNYLDTDWPTIQRLKTGHARCVECTRHGAHVLYPHLGKPHLKKLVDQMAMRELPRRSPPPSSRSLALPVLAGTA